MNRTIARRKRKLKSTELLSSTDPVRIKVDRSFPFEPSSMGGKVELSFLTLIIALLSLLRSYLPFERGTFFFQQSPSLKMATTQKQSPKQASMHQS